MSRQIANFGCFQRKKPGAVHVAAQLPGSEAPDVPSGNGCLCQTVALGGEAEMVIVVLSLHLLLGATEHVCTFDRVVHVELPGRTLILLHLCTQARAVPLSLRTLPVLPARRAAAVVSAKTQVGGGEALLMGGLFLLDAGQRVPEDDVVHGELVAEVVARDLVHGLHPSHPPVVDLLGLHDRLGPVETLAALHDLAAVEPELELTLGHTRHLDHLLLHLLLREEAQEGQVGRGKAAALPVMEDLLNPFGSVAPLAARAEVAPEELLADLVDPTAVLPGLHLFIADDGLFLGSLLADALGIARPRVAIAHPVGALRALSCRSPVTQVGHEAFLELIAVAVVVPLIVVAVVVI